MKVRQKWVTNHGIHSNVAAGDKDVLAADRLVINLQTKMAEAFDREEASCWEAEVWKAQKR